MLRYMQQARRAPVSCRKLEETSRGGDGSDNRMLATSKVGDLHPRLDRERARRFLMFWTAT
jgi:hypothetical protein